MYKKILVAYDFDNSFNNVPKELVRLTSGSAESEITVFNVITESELQTSVKYNDIHFEQLAKTKGKVIKPFIDELEQLGLNVTVKFGTGNIRNTILEEIEEHDYEIIVMSNKRSKPDIKNVLGNVTHKIANHAHIPVLIIK
ncbi:universal stress protein [Staphylococcus sp. ACRSN]|uniref:universal stress protein n=1 Tax=Staphylococcus sp. ACRSN TaxID=2918214 RepID=UPI001EF296D9|nr:universal stress protein [Staphylococcus sp. ACRSN]MCG7339062.1 universal stress protein [Staphylococcus sp. ACRSN]